MKTYTNTNTLLKLALLSALLFPASHLARADYIVTNVWKVLNGAGHIAGSDANRGIAYDAIANKVYVSSKASTAIDIIDGSLGTNSSTAIGSVLMTGVTGGNFGINGLGVSDDGVLYGANLNTTANVSPFYKIYRWADVTAAPTVAFAADPTLGLSTAGKRVGDSMAIRGAGTGTQILAPVASSSVTTNVIIFSTTDGTNFTPTLLAVTGIGALTGVQPGIAFYTNNTFLYRPGGNINSAVYVVQFPANFASLTSPVAATVIATNTRLAVNTANTSSSFFDVNPTAGLTAVYGPTANAATPATTTLNLFAVPPISGFALPSATTNTAHSLANGNGTGGVALGGQGKTNFIYTLDSNNGVYGFGIAFVPPQPPTISTAPVGVSGVFPQATLTVSANGSQPLSYQWLSSPNNVTFTNIPGATTNSYSVTAGTNYFEVLITNSVGSITSTPVLVSLLTPVTNSSVTNLWRIAAGTSGYSYLVTDDNGRGMAYDTNRNVLVVASTSGGAGLYLVAGTNGANAGTLSLSGLSLNGTKQLDQVSVADDGAVYAGNLALIGSGDAYHLYRWPAATNTATAVQVFTGDPGSGSGDRWGDYMDARGSGTGTQILLASKTTRVAFLTTTDGINFTSTLITITNVPTSFAGGGICFGAGNTFWAKTYLGHLYQVAFDPVTQQGGVVFDYATFPSRCIGVAVDSVRNILGSVNDNNSPKDLELFQLTGSSDAPILFDQVFFAAANANGNENAVVAMKYPMVFALDVNNGLAAATYGAPAATAPVITTQPSNLTAYTNDPTASFTVAVSGSLPLFYQWRFNGANIASGTNAALLLPNPQFSQAGNYDVIIHNLAGYTTSTPPAVLTVVTPAVSTVVTQAWRVAGGVRPYLDGSSYSTRGLAYDAITKTVLIADHFNLYLVAATNGADLGTVVPAGLPVSGINGWTIDQIAVADDGVLYSCNLATGGAGFAIVSYSTPISTSFVPANYAFGGSSGADPAGTGDRFGDTMDARGAGTGTELICASQNGTVVVVFDTTDGTTFNAHVITVADAPAGFAGEGVAFGSGNTFWAKSPGYNLRQVSYDKGTGVGTMVQSFVAGTQIDSGLCGIDLDAANNILAGVSFSDAPNDVRLYALSGDTNLPSLFDQEFFASRNSNGQFNAVTALRSGFGVGLDVNNGILAFNYGIPAAPAVQLSVTYQAGTGATLTWPGFGTHTYQVQYRDSLTTGNWTNIGSPVSGVNGVATYVDNTGLGTRFYRVVSQ
jgi:hypothetical protein